MAKEKRLHEITYNKHAAKINDDCLPVLPHTSDTHEMVKPDEAYIEKVGIVERNGEELEYQVLRVYFKREEQL